MFTFQALSIWRKNHTFKILRFRPPERRQSGYEVELEVWLCSILLRKILFWWVYRVVSVRKKGKTWREGKLHLYLLLLRLEWGKIQRYLPWKGFLSGDTCVPDECLASLRAGGVPLIYHSLIFYFCSWRRRVFYGASLLLPQWMKAKSLMAMIHFV